MSYKQKSPEHFRIDPRAARSFSAGLGFDQNDVRDFAALSGMGICLTNEAVRHMITSYGFDSNDVGINPVPLSGVTSPSIAAQIQFLQNWLPGFVNTVTQARKIDDLVGISTSGAWEDEEIVQGTLEPVGTSVPYVDWGNSPLASWNATFETRTIVRFEQGFFVGRLEDARSARMRISTAAEKRNASQLSLDIDRNRVGFYGYNGGANRTFGFLNDPNLPAYITLPNGAAGSPRWNQKTFTEITADIRNAASALRTQSGEVIDPNAAAITMALPTSARDMLSVTTNANGYSVTQWLKESYPTWRVESAPELNDANGGASVMYVYAETVADGSTDDNRTFIQVVPAKFMALGVEQKVKGYIEGMANATAGVMNKRPYAVYRATGL